MNRSQRLIINESIKSPIGEAYRAIRTNIQFSMPKGQLKTILVTSSTPGEGKSTTAANLAITMAESGIRVLLIDADLRKPTIYKLFQVSNLKGLTNVLAEGADYREFIKPTVVEGLDILPAGPNPPNPSELLGSDGMRELLDLAKNHYDLVILDTPPVLPVTDAAILASQVDGVVFITAHGQATFDAVARSKTQLENVGAKILGVILNRVPVSKRSGNSYYYYEGYGSSEVPERTLQK